MNWYYNLKVSVKLLIGFCIIAIIAGFIGYEGITSLETVHEEDKILYEKNTVALGVLGDLSTKFQMQRASILQLVTSTEPAIIDEQTERIAELDAEIDRLIPEYKKTYVDDTDKKMFEEWEASFREYENVRNKVEELSKQNKTVEALALYRGGMEKAREMTQELTEKIDEFNIKAAKERSESNTEHAESAISLMMVLIASGIVLSVVLGIFISRIISNQIKKLSVVADKLAIGDVNVSVDAKTKDELGDLERSFAMMIENIKVQALVAEKIAQGDTSVVITAKSDQDVLSKSMIRVVDTVRSLVAEALMLSKAAVEGKLNTRGNASKFNGGYKELVEGVNNTLDSVIKPVQEGSEILELMASGDFTPRMMGDYQGDHQILKNSVNKLGDSISKVIRDVTEAVQATASASNQISSSTEELAAGAQEQSSQSQEIAGAVTQMTSTIMETSKHANTASENAKNAGSIAKEGGKVVQETVEGMNRVAEVVSRAAVTVKELGKSSDQIGEIVQVIDDIADQTNLLALNAAIEAARAGEQGRGFAVVADEVRKLAERTTKATKEIATMIKRIQKDTGEAVVSMDEGTKEVEKGKELAEKAGDSLRQIISAAEQVVDVINQVAAASEEQSSTSEQITRNIESISNVTHEAASGTQQIARAAEDLNHLTTNLQELIMQFKIDESQSKNERSQYSVHGNGKMRRLVHA